MMTWVTVEDFSNKPELFEDTLIPKRSVLTGLSPRKVISFQKLGTSRFSLPYDNQCLLSQQAPTYTYCLWFIFFPLILFAIMLADFCGTSQVPRSRSQAEGPYLSYLDSLRMWDFRKTVYAMTQLAKTDLFVSKLLERLRKDGADTCLFCGVKRYN